MGKNGRAEREGRETPEKAKTSMKEEEIRENASGSEGEEMEGAKTSRRGLE